jgi:hypothetical protein|tara:strand:+ start:417 stop:557 length:141 start_codon:yes stop_codon:yes gene_type:complete
MKQATNDGEEVFAEKALRVVKKLPKLIIKILVFIILFWLFLKIKTI